MARTAGVDAIIAQGLKLAVTEHVYVRRFDYQMGLMALLPNSGSRTGTSDCGWWNR